jgi:hypothetical protein
MNLRTIVAWAALLALVAVAPVYAQPPTAPPQPVPFAPRQTPAASQPATRQIQGFNIVLVLGETQRSGGTEAVDDLPGGAKKALADIREFLPYKHYRVLDSQWTSCCGTDSLQLSGRLRGLIATPGGNNAMNLVPRPYAFSIFINPRSPGFLAVRFGLTLEDGDAPGHPLADSDSARAHERADLQSEIATLSLQIREMERKVEVGAMAPLDVRPLHDKQASLQRRLEAVGGATHAASPVGFGARPIIDSSFSMDPGETVVVGTSRLGGDKALIALVTAVRRTGSRD